jgi:hypothetical protein
MAPKSIPILCLLPTHHPFQPPRLIGEGIAVFDINLTAVRLLYVQSISAMLPHRGRGFDNSLVPLVFANFVHVLVPFLPKLFLAVVNTFGIESP